MKGNTAATINLRQLVMITLLLAAVVVSALAVVFVSYKNRELFIALQQLQKAETGMEIQLGQLLLEEGAWSSPVVVERKARAELQMLTPQEGQLLVAVVPEGYRP